MTIHSHQQRDAELRPRSQRRRRTRRLLLIVGLIVLIGAGDTAWWLFSPLFIHNTANDANPFAGTSSTASTPAHGSTSTATPAGSVILATGKFIDKANSGAGLANDHGSGNVTIGRAADGTYVIHFDHLNVTNGPDLHVYLAPTSNSTDAEQVKSTGVDLGTLAATEGSLNVTIPADIGKNLTKYHSVVIVCKTFSVIFTTAPISFSSTT